MPANLIAKDKIRELADTAAGLKVPGGNPRLKVIMARLLNDLFVAIDDFDISMDEVWAAVAYLAKAAPEYGLVVPGIGEGIFFNRLPTVSVMLAKSNIFDR